MTRKQRLVVIGNGMAGARLVEEIVSRPGGEHYEITVLGAEPYGNYNRILLSGVLAGSYCPEHIFLHPLSWYQEHGIRLHAGRAVTAIDWQGHRVQMADGDWESYDRLVIATGSSPYLPPLENLLREDGRLIAGAFTFRTLDDCQALLAYSSQARRAVVIGGGLLGLEAASGLRQRGLEVHLVHRSPHLLNLQLDSVGGAILARLVSEQGVQLHLGKETVAMLGQDRLCGLRFSDGSELACDLCVIATGTTPNIALARAAGLAVKRGIIIDDDLACSVPDIFAIGECAEHRGQTYGLVAPLWEQARILAERLTDSTSRKQYTGSAISTRLKVSGLDLTVMGDKEPAGPDDEVITYAEPTRGIYKKLIIREGRLQGAILLGDLPGSVPAARLVQLFHRGDPLPANRVELLFPCNGKNQQAVSVAELPDDTQICNCNGVSKGAILAAVRAGKRSLKALCDATRAATGCGSCKSQVQELLVLACEGEVVEDPSVHYYVPAIPLTKPELVRVIKERGLRSVSAVFQALANGQEDPTSKAGLASLLKTIWGKDYEDERDARFINDRVHANIQKDGTFSVVPRIYGGVTTPEQLRRIADVAEKYHVPLVKITGGQRIDLVGVRKEQLPAIWKDLGMPSGHAYTKAFRTCKTCLGSDFCRYGLGDSTTLGIKIEKRYQGIEMPHKVKLATAGCPRNCSEATTKDLGAVAIEGGRWEIYVGGAAGSRVRKGDLLCTVNTHEEVLLYMGRFMQYYRENAKYQERSYDFVERIGIEQLRRVLVEDAEGICARLDRDIQAAVEAYVDPWQREAEQPVTPTQFSEALEATPISLGAGN
ncbi:nitrite reductase large subunit NirB [Thermogemmatispora sp.]|uniref:nitrite reductase large subunit NirB n=1 Tax=Thermogemmatispora sp. TaxID=1968838 RepID=UPI001D4BB072|nr:nitrite reductase large subunit NirB [Thermogemmatispora sp.]MBX5449468.1 NAD(P)/FAD-dependent oxidoreductase [Thermogemmatispora sp.]